MRSTILFDLENANSGLYLVITGLERLVKLIVIFDHADLNNEVSGRGSDPRKKDAASNDEEAGGIV